MKAHLLKGQIDVPPAKKMTCAVYVTYHPDTKFPDRMARIGLQVAYTVIVDNNSNEEAVKMLRALCGAGKCELIENEENLGIATALNQGIKRAIDLGYDWALTLDQDSWPEVDLIATFSEIYNTHPDSEKVKMIGCNYRYPITGHSFITCEDPKARFIETHVVITSCSLMSLRAFEEVGPFRDDFFIDEVDHEYCLRLRSYDYKVVISCKPLMTHYLGNQTRHKLLWKRPISSNHPPLRRYYITRNRIVVYKKYIHNEPQWVKKSLYTAMMETALIILYENKKLEKFRAIMLGIWHALSGRMGRLNKAFS